MSSSAPRNESARAGQGGKLSMALRARAETFWQARSVSERRWLRLAVWFAVPTLLLFGLALPLHDHVQRLERQVPALRLQASAVRAMHDEMLAMPIEVRAPASTGSAGTSTGMAGFGERLRSRLDSRVPGFRGTVTRSERGFEVTIERAAFNGLLQWLAEVQRDEALFVVEARFVATGAAAAAGERSGSRDIASGQVSGRVLLAQGGS